MTVQKALNRPTDKKRLTEQLTKLGESVFFAQNTVVETEEDANIPIKEINECRRKAVSELERKLCEIPERRQKNPPPTPFYEKKEHLMLTAQVETEEQLRACEDAGVEVIYIPVSLIKEARRGSCQYVVRLPEICDSERIYDIPKEFGVLISSVGQALQYPEYKKYGNFRLNIVNDYSAELFADYESVALSQELNMKELMTLHPGVPAETVGYGKLPLMIMKNCPRRAIEGQCKKDRAVLRDRKNETFEFSCDGECHSILLNSKNIYMADRVKDFEKTAISRIRLMFFDEKYEKTRAVIEEYRRGIDGETVAKPPENSCTRGHFYRGVQ